MLASVAALIGYFEVVPGAYDLFTRFGRATGSFKDPNVFGPFLVPPFLYMLHIAINRPWRRIAVPLAVAGFFALAVFLSFSRGAWLNLMLALAVYGWMAYVTSDSPSRRARIVHLIAAGLVMVCIVVVGALQNERIVSLLAERASVTQSYDVGPEGRFGGQAKAVGLILENPLGIGATVFADHYHAEEVHNVYLSMLLNNGWLGGGLYLLMTVLTLVLGLRYALGRLRPHPLFTVAYAAFAANALEGLIIDIDHWRHVYLLMAIVWGTMAVKRTPTKPERGNRIVADRRPVLLRRIIVLAPNRRRARLLGSTQGAWASLLPRAAGRRIRTGKINRKARITGPAVPKRPARLMQIVDSERVLVRRAGPRQFATLAALTKVKRGARP